MVEGRYFVFGFLWLLWSLDYLTLHVTTALVLGVFLITGGHYTLYLAWNTLPRDLRGAKRYLQLLFLVYRYQKTNTTVPQVFSKVAAKHPSKAALLYENTSWSFGDLEKYSNRVANYLYNVGYRQGDCVALFMENRPEYVGIWLGCTKIGVVPALINANLQGNPLIHSLKAASAKGLIYGSELGKAVHDIARHLDGLDLFFSTDSVAHNDSVAHHDPQHVSFDVAIRKSPSEPVPKHLTEKLKFTDKMLYIYTSGTTGLPKAAVIKHSRLVLHS